MRATNGLGGRVARALGGRAPAELALRLTLLDLLLRPAGTGPVRVLLLGAAVLGLLVPGWLTRPALWGPLAAGAALRPVLDWPVADNHAFLLAYWCLAAWLAGLARDPRILASNARWMIGLVFSLATLWKLLSPDFLDGTFFRVTFVTDPRFDGLARLLAGIDAPAVGALRDALGRPADLHGAASPFPPLPRRLAHGAEVATWGVLGLEAAVAAAFLGPRGHGLARARHALLLLFCASVYAVAPVSGFAWLLLAMGAAQTDRDAFVTRSLYVGVFLLVLAYRDLPWSGLLVEGPASSR